MTAVMYLGKCQESGNFVLNKSKKVRADGHLISAHGECQCYTFDE